MVKNAALSLLALGVLLLPGCSRAGKGNRGVPATGETTGVRPAEPRPAATEADIRAAAKLLPEPGTFMPLRCRDGSHKLFEPYSNALKGILAKSGAAELALRLVRDPDRGVRYVSADILINSRPENRERDILAAIRAETERRVVHKLLPALWRYETPVAARCLLECLESGLPSVSTERIIGALGCTRQPEIAPKVIGYLSSQNSNLWRPVLDACVRAGNPEVVPEIKAFALRLKSRIASADPKQPFPSRESTCLNLAFEALFILHREEGTFRFLAQQQQERTKSIGHHPDYRYDCHTETLPRHILDSYLSQSWGTDKRLAVAYMDRVFGTAHRTKDALARWRERYVRIGNRVVPLLLDCIFDPDPVVSREALRALTGRAARTPADEKATIRAALRRLSLSEGEKPLYLAECFLAYRNDEMVDLLSRLAHESLDSRAFEAARQLVLVDKEAGLTRLLDFLRSPDRRSAIIAAQMLAHEKDDSGLGVLLEAARTDKNRSAAENYARSVAACLGVGLDVSTFPKHPDWELARLEGLWKGEFISKERATAIALRARRVVKGQVDEQFLGVSSGVWSDGTPVWNVRYEHVLGPRWLVVLNARTGRVIDNRGLPSR